MALSKSRFCQGYFGGRSSFCVQGERKTIAVCNCHNLGPLATLGFSNPRAPFLAAEMLLSIMPSVKSSLPRLCRSSAKPFRIALITPSLTQRWKRRCTVACAPYRVGRSCQGAAVRRIQRMPSRIERESFDGLPRPSLRLGLAGMYSLSMFRCSSVRSIRVSLYTSDSCTRSIYEMGSSALW